VPELKRLVRRKHDVDRIGDLSPLLSRLYAGRGIKSADQVEHQLKHLLPPDSMKGLANAASLLAEGVREGKRLLVIGDFDADGATSCTLMVHGLLSLGATWASYLVPNRFEYGYGLTPEIVEASLQFEPEVIITVDNGISSIEGIEAAKKRSIRTVITDHHLPGNRLPAADAIVNPNQPGCSFPSKNLAGVGVAFYLLSAIRQDLRQSGWFANKGIKEPNLADYLDLVALGTIADVVPMDYNNRVLVQEGLRRIRAGRSRPGLLAMIQVSGKAREHLVATDLAFMVAPRLNAAGRLEDISLGIECLLAEDDQRALELASSLDTLNRERRDIENEMKDQAMVNLDKDVWISAPWTNQGQVPPPGSDVRKERFR
jgi:single-stranded-DNA-specific exonuclease